MQRGHQTSKRIEVLPIEFRVVLRLSGLARSVLRWRITPRTIGRIYGRVKNYLALHGERKELDRREREELQERVRAALTHRSGDQ